MAYLKTYAFQHALSVAVTVAFSFLVSLYLGNPITYWMVFIALLITPITRGTSLRQSLLAFIIVIAALIFALLLLSLELSPITILIIVIFAYLLCILLISKQGTINEIFSYQNFIFFLILLFALLSYPIWRALTVESFSTQMTIGVMNFGDAILAGIIGIAVSQFIFPAKITREFKRGLVPVLTAFANYHDGVINAFILHEHDLIRFKAQRIQLENSLQARRGIYPNWVYEVGFNLGLRKGYRFFLVHLEILIEELFALTSITSSPIDVAVIKALEPQIIQAKQINDQLFVSLIDFFTTEKMNSNNLDYMRDIIDLENVLRTIMPGNLDLLELMPDYLNLVAFAQTTKDIRERLLQLILAVS